MAITIRENLFGMRGGVSMAVPGWQLIVSEWIWEAGLLWSVHRDTAYYPIPENAHWPSAVGE
jgi:hypothetical protein